MTTHSGMSPDSKGSLALGMEVSQLVATIESLRASEFDLTKEKEELTKRNEELEDAQTHSKTEILKLQGWNRDLLQQLSDWQDMVDTQESMDGGDTSKPTVDVAWLELEREQLQRQVRQLKEENGRMKVTISEQMEEIEAMESKTALFQGENARKRTQDLELLRNELKEVREQCQQLENEKLESENEFNDRLQALNMALAAANGSAADQKEKFAHDKVAMRQTIQKWQAFCSDIRSIVQIAPVTEAEYAEATLPETLEETVQSIVMMKDENLEVRASLKKTVDQLQKTGAELAQMQETENEMELLWKEREAAQSREKNTFAQQQQLWESERAAAFLSQISELKTGLDAMESKLASQAETLAFYEGTNATLEEQCDRWRQRAETAEGQIQNRSEEAAKWSNEAALRTKQTARLAKEKASLQVQVLEFAEVLTSVRAKHNELLSELEQWKSSYSTDLQQMQWKCRRFKETVQKSNEAIVKAEQSQEALDDLRQQIDVLASELRDVKRKLFDTDSYNARLRGDLQVAEAQSKVALASLSDSRSAAAVTAVEQTREVLERITHSLRAAEHGRNSAPTSAPQSPP
jgi:chromosome segregation ATPase